MANKLKLLVSSAMVAVAFSMPQAIQGMDDIPKLGQQQKPSGALISKEAAKAMIDIIRPDLDHIVHQQLHRVNLFTSSFLSGTAYSLIPEAIRGGMRCSGYSRIAEIADIAAIFVQGGAIAYHTFFASCTPTVAPTVVGMAVRAGAKYLGLKEQEATYFATTAAVLTTAAQDVFIYGEGALLDSVANYGIAFVGSCAGTAFALNAESLVCGLWERKDVSKPQPTPSPIPNVEPIQNELREERGEREDKDKDKDKDKDLQGQINDIRRIIPAPAVIPSIPNIKPVEDALKREIEVRIAGVDALHARVNQEIEVRIALHEEIMEEAKIREREDRRLHERIDRERGDAIEIVRALEASREDIRILREQNAELQVARIEDQNRARAALLNAEIDKTIRNIQHTYDQSQTYWQLYDRLRKMRWYYIDAHHGDDVQEHRDALARAIDGYVAAIEGWDNLAGLEIFRLRLNEYLVQGFIQPVREGLMAVAQGKMTAYEQIQGGVIRHPRRGERLPIVLGGEIAIP